MSSENVFSKKRIGGVIWKSFLVGSFAVALSSAHATMGIPMSPEEATTRLVNTLINHFEEGDPPNFNAIQRLIDFGADMAYVNDILGEENVNEAISLARYEARSQEQDADDFFVDIRDYSPQNYYDYPVLNPGEITGQQYPMSSPSPNRQQFSEVSGPFFFNSECLQYLNTPNNQGNTPLHRAVEAGDIESVKVLLLQSGIDPNIQNKHGQTPLHMAVELGFVDLVRALLLCPLVNENIPFQEMKNTPLHFVLEKNRDLKMLRVLLLPSSVNVNAQNINGDTPLHIAVRKGNFDGVKFLLLRGANLHAANEVAKYPLDLAEEFPEIHALLESFL
jgi:hypothetical protein